MSMLSRNLCEQQEFVISNKIFYVDSFPFFPRGFLSLSFFFFSTAQFQTQVSPCCYFFPSHSCLPCLCQSTLKRKAGHSWTGICWLNEDFWHQWPFAVWQVMKSWRKHSHPILFVTEFRWLQNREVHGTINIPPRDHCWKDEPWGIFEVCERPSLPHSDSYCQSWILAA